VFIRLLAFFTWQDIPSQIFIIWLPLCFKVKCAKNVATSHKRLREKCSATMKISFGKYLYSFLNSLKNWYQLRLIKTIFFENPAHCFKLAVI
jgi:hypothetical protein